MMKKTLATLAVMGVFAGSATAADVTLYGVADLGLKYSHKKTTDGAERAKTNALELASGMNADSSFGIKGSEELGNGLTVEFNLENGFNADDGSLGQDGRLFGLEALVSVSGNFGSLSFGCMGGVGSAAGTYDVVFANGDAFGGGDNDVFGFYTSDRYDNMITYQTPVFAGLQGTFQYSFKKDTTNDEQKSLREGSSAVDRYASAAITGTYGNLTTVLAYEHQNYASLTDHVDDGQTIYFGGNYDFGIAQIFAMGERFKSADLEVAEEASLKDGWGAHVGTIVPVAGGNVTAGLYYVDAKASENSAIKVDYLGASVRYDYSLSKRTTLYTGLGYAQEKADGTDGVAEKKINVGQAYVGLTHAF